MTCSDSSKDRKPPFWLWVLSPRLWNSWVVRPALGILYQEPWPETNQHIVLCHLVVVNKHYEMVWLSKCKLKFCHRFLVKSAQGFLQKYIFLKRSSSKYRLIDASDSLIPLQYLYQHRIKTQPKESKYNHNLNNST